MQRRRRKGWENQQQQETKQQQQQGKIAAGKAIQQEAGSSAEMQLWPTESNSQITAKPSGVESELQTDQASGKPMKTLD